MAHPALLEFEKPLLRIQQDIAMLEVEQSQTGRDHSAEIRQQQARLVAKTKRLYSNLTAWETVLVARHAQRPLITDHIRNIVQDFCELHGDRGFGDDRAMVTGFGRIGGHKVMIVGHNKGKDTKERLICNFGCAHPEGYRKALRKMKLAEKFHLPVVCMIDTQGAYPGIGSEERGISQAIAVNMMEMSRLRVPIVCVVIGEGGSGGALGIGVGDRVAVFQNAFYSVISAEGCAAILWKTADQRERAAEALKFTARDLKRMEIIDDILPEPLGGAHRNPMEASRTLEKYLTETLSELSRPRIDTVVKRRYERFRQIASFFNDPSSDADKPLSRKRGGVGQAFARVRRIASTDPVEIPDLSS
ncbi:MAG: acetyl-CoA carboxylase carboxyltransferase subunit alpha [Phycisphaerales bacterium]|nr:acetyl-CoA carboxylase carboxyltransferase subunit alpha [Phycisphaerales bacterium]